MDLSSRFTYLAYNYFVERKSKFLDKDKTIWKDEILGSTWNTVISKEFRRNFIKNNLIST